MPFITEELWQNLKRSLPPGWQAIESIMMAPYPEADAKVIDPKAEQVMEALIDIIRAIRNTRAEYNVESDRWIEAKIYASKLTTTITPYSETIQTLARARPLTFLRKRQKGAQDENVLVSVLKGGEVVIPMTSMFDLEAERKKLQKEIDQSQAEIARLKARLEDKEFLAKAPTEVIDKERQKFYTLSDKLERLKQQIPKAY
jgi:valyl-tRNA synthetase